jgi:hypothetical protein
LVATHAVKNFIRNREFFKIISAIETGADHGMWGFQRYCKWLETRTNLFVPGQGATEPPDSEPAEAAFVAVPLSSASAAPRTEKKSGIATPAPGTREGHRIEIEPVEGEFGKILKRPQ